jgi:hypothetical protein
MHALERRMATCLEDGLIPEPGHFGGFGALVQAAGDIALSPLMPEFLRMVLALFDDSEHTNVASDLVGRYIGGARDDIVWIETVKLLDAAVPLPSRLAEQCFSRFLSVAGDRKFPPMARAAALDGSMRWAVGDLKRHLRLALILADPDPDDNPDYLARVAKVMGVAYAHWREPWLLDGLEHLVGLEGVADEAAFELGMAKLADGLDAQEPVLVSNAFNEAQRWFRQAVEARPQRPDARLYALCLDAVKAFADGGAVIEAVQNLSREAFQVHAWHSSPEDPSWLGARHLEMVLWEKLALRMTGLVRHLEDVLWWEPAVVIEHHLLEVYCAGRAILKRNRDGGIESMVRPRIEGSLVRERHHAALLNEWLKRNPKSDWRPEAESLVAIINDLMGAGEPGQPPEAATARPTVAAWESEARIPRAVREVLDDARRVHTGNMSAAEVAVLEHCCNTASECTSDYRDNGAGRTLFHAVLVWTLRFLFSRLELTKGNASCISYLFKRPDGTLPHEAELQTDYYNLMLSNVAGTEIEVSNVGGGRADVRFVYSGERLVVEVKREDKDASFEALAERYATQATDYQNVSLRIGILLVLDQTKVPTDGTPHLRSLVRPIAIPRRDEHEPRLLVIIKVPGRRLRPSDQSKASKPRRGS